MCFYTLCLRDILQYPPCLKHMKDFASKVSLKKPVICPTCKTYHWRFALAPLHMKIRAVENQGGNVWAALFLYLVNSCSYVFLCVVLNLRYILFAFPHYFMEWGFFFMKFSWTKEIRVIFPSEEPVNKLLNSHCFIVTPTLFRLGERRLVLMKRLSHSLIQ